MEVTKEKEEIEIINQYLIENRRCKRNKAIMALVIMILEMALGMVNHHHKEQHQRDLLRGKLITKTNLGNRDLRNQRRLVVVRHQDKVAKANQKPELAWVLMVRRRRPFFSICIQMAVVLMYN